MKEDKIIKKLTDHDKRFDNHDKRFDCVDEKIERLAIKMGQLDDKIGRVDSKINEFKDDILSAIDSYAKKTTDVEIEQLSTRATLDRHEDEIITIKKKIKIA